jgi:hypothetical protein
MKKTYSLIRKIVLITVLVLTCMQLFAQDKITLTWKVDDVNTPKNVICSTNGEISINWGDNIIETITGNGTSGGIIFHFYESVGEYEVTIAAFDVNCQFKQFLFDNNQILKLNFFECSDLTTIKCDYNQLTNLDLTGCTALRDFFCSNNQITNLNVSDCTSLTYLFCSNNQITNLDLSTCSLLEYLDCSYNKFTDIDLSVCPALEELNCNNNQLQFSVLYAIQLLPNGNFSHNFGSQYLPATYCNINTELFADQSVFGGIFTQYTVEINDEPAPESTYSVTDGKLTFHTSGKYTVTMTNNVLHSSDDPAQVIVEIDVLPVGIAENKALNISVYPNPTMGELRITNYELEISDIEVFDVYGRKQKAESRKKNEIDISHLPAGIYFVKITTEKGQVVKKVVKY